MKLTNPKIQKLAPVVVSLMMLFISACTTNSGGSSSPGGSSASRTLKETEIDVSWPMTRFHNAVPTGGVTPSEQAQVNDAYSRFKAAYSQALQAAHNNPNAPAPDNVKALATQVISAVQAIP
jgi:hypothetical protein